MAEKDKLQELLSPKKNADKAWYLSLLDKDAQAAYEAEHLGAVLRMLKVCYIYRYRRHIADLRAECDAIRGKENYTAEDFRALQEKKAEIALDTRRINEYKPFFSEPYFARMDVVDDKEGYNSYYIGKKGDVNLEIVDWRAPLAVRYYQKSRVTFTINEYEYRTVLRRALSVKNGKVLDFRNEYLSVGDVLTPEEIGGRDEEILFDPYLRSIIQSRKDDVKVRDIIRTIQEQQFEIVTLPERENFVLQGCAGSGKTMIMLHRLSYLMYNNESLRPGDVLVITPSESFNGFIDELSQMLELQKVRTTTLTGYYFRALAGEGIDLKSRLTSEREPEAYLGYVYSARFPEETAARVQKLYRELLALFTAPECRSVSESVLAMCRARREQFVRVRNASVRVRRAVLGELKENKEGGFYFTKPFRTLMNAYVQAEDFLQFVLEEHERTPDYFFRQLSEFYRSAHVIVSGGEKVFADAQSDLAAKVFADAQSDLAALAEAVEKEIADLRRYKQKRGAQEVLTYPDRIARREQLLEETRRIRELIGAMTEGLELTADFFAVLRLTRACNARLYGARKVQGRHRRRPLAVPRDGQARQDQVRHEGHLSFGRVCARPCPHRSGQAAHAPLRARLCGRGAGHLRRGVRPFKAHPLGRGVQCVRRPQTKHHAVARGTKLEERMRKFVHAQPELPQHERDRRLCFRSAGRRYAPHRAGGGGGRPHPSPSGERLLPRKAGTEGGHLQGGRSPAL